MVEAGGTVGSHQGVNLPASHAGSMPAAGASDMDWVEFACEHEIDLLAVSFVRGAVDLEPVTERIKQRGGDIPLIAKIEKPQAAKNAEEIIAAAGSGIMVARGDLGIELPIETIPATQKRLIELAGKQQKPAITATQMLASMVSSDRPTRAEVTDVANAIYDGTDAVMLSEETAIGDHPVEAVRVMDRVARATEPDLPYEDWLYNRVESAGDVAASVAQGAVGATYRLGIKAIVVATMSGRTARVVSALRPRVPILAISGREETVRRLNLLFGVRCAHHHEWQDLRELLDDLRGDRPRRGRRRRRRPDRGHRRPPRPGARHEPVRGPPGPLARRDLGAGQRVDPGDPLPQSRVVAGAEQVDEDVVEALAVVGSRVDGRVLEEGEGADVLEAEAGAAR